MTQPLTVSVVVPARNAERVLPSCLEAIRASAVRPQETIVVDDQSTDGTAAAARRHGVTTLATERRSGPGAARNLAARHARGEILMFVDADVTLHPDAIGRVVRRLAADTGLSAVFGSYDEQPAATNFLSQYKNLFHHYVHQRSDSRADTFWAACGAIRREIFLAVGGFDAEKYPRPSIEDIELGYRLRRSGHDVALDRDLLCKHLKRWTIGSLLHADIVRRAVPWSDLILATGKMGHDLNLRPTDRLNAALVCLSAGAVALASVFPSLLVVSLSAVIVVLITGSDLYLFFLKHRGVVFTLRAIPMHLLYYLYGGSTFVLRALVHGIPRRTAGGPASPIG